MFFINSELMKKCEEIEEHLNLILEAEKPSVMINDIFINFDTFELRVYHDNMVFLRLDKDDQKVAFVNIDSIKEIDG